ncbi:hypothetical protein ACTFIU_004019 [Dictyostelium citrinum]
MNKFIKILFIFLALFYVIEASHFRFGTISWQPTTDYRTIKFTSNFAYRTTMFYSSASGIKIGDLVNVGSLNYGGGQGSISVSVTVTSFDTVNDWFTGSHTITKVYPTQTSGTIGTYTVVFTDCCRIGSLINNANGYWNITANVQIDNKNQLSSVNWPPVSGMLPIVQVKLGKNNNFRVIASDQNVQAGESSELAFSFSTVYPMTQPSGMTIDSSGNCYFLPTQVGLYSTQIYVLDSRGAYIVVDFILQSVTESGTCDPTCSNAGTSCTQNSQCKGCTNTGSTTIDTCTTSNYPPSFVSPPTLDDGQTKAFPIDTSTSVTLSCKTIMSGRTTSIQLANLPIGVAVTTPVTGQTNNVTLTWKPATSNTGSYVVSATCSDSTGLTSSVRSFTMLVAKPDCGNGGTTVGGVCQCTGNWNSTYKCFECKDGYYGENCIAVPPCVNGVPNSGINGDGKCLCNNGWTGADCSTSFSQSCASLSNNNLSISYSNPSFINPTKVQVYLTSTPNYEVPTIVSIPSPINNLDVYVLVDANVASTTLFGYIKTGVSQIVTSITGISENSQFGIGYFSDYPSGPVNFNPSLVIGSAIGPGINLYSPSSYTSTSNGNSLTAATAVAGASVGWNTGSFKIVIIITDSDHTSSSSTSFTNAFISKSIVPVVVGFGASSMTNWNSAISSSGFGYSAISAATAADLNAKVTAGVKSVLASVIYKADPTSTGYSFISSVPSTVAVSGSTQKTVNGLKLSLPSGTTIVSPVASVSAMGYGRMDISINYNRPPVATAGSFSVNQNSFATFKLTGTDPDSNILQFKFTTFLAAAAGVITDSDGIDVSTQQSKYYPSTETFTYTPTTNYLTSNTIRFVAFDGCVESNTYATISITINKVNQLPVCSSVSSTITTTLNTASTFSVTATDFEDASPFLQFTKPTDLTTYGTFTYKGAAITSSTKITTGDSIIFTQTVNPAADVSITLQFQAIDSSNAFSQASCSVSFKLQHKNTPPVSSSTSPISVIPRGSVALTFVSTDSDSTSTKFTIKSVGKGANGNFYTCTSNDCTCKSTDSTSTPVVLGTTFSSISYTSKVANKVICFDNQEPSAVSNYASISFTSTDDEGLESNTVTVVVNIVGSRTNVAPVVTKIPDYSVYQDYLDSDSHVVTGTDTDIDDYNPPNVNNLVAVITTPPSHGILITVQNGNTIATQGNAPFTHYYRPNPGYSGTDSYSYQVVDTFKAASTIATTTITVNPINHKPTVTVNSYSFTSQSGAGVSQNLVTSDPDGDSVICSVVAIPSQISMYDSDDNLIETVPTVLSGTSYSFKLLNPSEITPTPFTSVSSTFSVSCTDVTSKTTPFGSLSTGVVTGNVQYTYINTPPTTQGGTVQLDQDTVKSFTFNGSDIESPLDLKVKILSLPINGQLLYGGVALTTQNIGSTYNLDALSYKPNAGLSNWTTVDHKSPLDSISYSIVDKQGLLSDSDIIYFSVTPRNPPVYTGAREIDVLQNTRYPLTITGKVGDGGSQVNIQVIDFTKNGTLSIAHNMGSEGTVDSEITTYPNSQSGSTSYNYAYMPPHNRYGPKFDYIYFKLFDGDLYSELYTVTVNVIHVNQPPTIQLISYKILDDVSSETLFGSTSLINMNVNTSVLIKYSGNDIDVDQVTPLLSTISNIPLRGSLHAYDPTASNSLGANINRNSPNVKQNADTFYYVVFVPSAKTSGENYARIPFVMIDNGGLMSPTATVTINVNTVNIAPFVIIGNKNYTTQTNLTASVLGVQFDDPDSVNNNVSITVSIVGEKDDNVASLKDVKLSFTKTPYCSYHQTLASISCTAPKKPLNNTISSISVIASTAGNYRLKLFVDDLGYNAPAAVRAQSHLNATGYVDIKVNTPEATTQPTSNKTVLTGAIAGAAAGTALIAAAAWKLLRKAAPPTDTFFSEAAFLGDGVNANPLYEQSATAAENPLYQSASDASHLRYGTIKWQPITQYNVIQFTLDLGFRSSYYFGSRTPTTNDSIGIFFYSGDSNQYNYYNLGITTVDPINDWVTGTSIFIYTYPTLEVGQIANYTATYTECCRLSTLLNNRDETFTLKTLVQIDNKNVFNKVNWSPVSGMVPLYPVAYGKNNNFNIRASDPNLANGVSSKLVFTFGNAKPTGMTLDPNTGAVYFIPGSTGLYCAQIIITDNNGAYITLDFIIQSQLQVGVCHYQCSNGGSNCGKNSDCTSCGSLDNSQTEDFCISTKPNFIFPPTPMPNETQTFVIGQQNYGFKVSCTTDAKNKNTTILPVAFPMGVQTKYLVNGPTSTMEISWFPTSIHEIGTYQKFIECTDSLIKIVTSVEIRVVKPDCSNGGYRKDDVCICQKQFTSESDCLECSKGYYGEKCIPVPACVNGVSNSGILGDGKCYCDNGWIGDDCSISNSQSCGSLKSGVVSSSIVQQYYINPVGIQVYLANNSKYDIPIDIKIPEKNKLIDVYFLIDINQNTEEEFKNILSQLDAAKSKILELSPEGVSFGLGIIDLNGYYADLARIPSNSFVTALENKYWSGNNSLIRGKSLSAATKAAKTPLGWRTNSFRSMIIIPRTDLTLDTSQTEINEFKNAFIEKSIAPIVIGINVSLSSWNSTLSQCGFGVYKLSSEAKNWKNFVKLAYKEISSSVLGNGVLQNVIFKTNDNTGGLEFLKSIPNNLPINADADIEKTISGLSLSLPVKYNSSVYPSLQVCSIGFGCVDIKINYNHPPTPEPFGFSCGQNSAYTFQLKGNDPDRNILTFKFTSFLLATEGTIKTSNGVDVSTQKDEQYLTGELFTFSPYKNYLKPLSVNFVANDGCLTSDSSAAISISIYKVNQPPECTSTMVISEFEKTVSFSFAATDFEDDSLSLIPNAQFSVSSELATLEQYGQLTYNGGKVTINTIIKKGENLYFKQTKNPLNLLVPLTFKAKDSSSLFSNPCTLTINITHTNEAPISRNGISSIIPRGTAAISLLSTDIDSTSAAFTIKMVNNGEKGTFFSCPDYSCSCVSDRIAVTENKKYNQIQYTNNQATLSICFSNGEPEAISNYSSISFTSTDNQGLESNLATILVNIVGDRANVAPIVNKIQDYSCYQDYKDSEVHAVTGTDADIDDYNPPNVNNLIAVITTPPSHGILITVENGSSIVTQGNAPLIHYYRPNPGFAGTDSYSYQVIDTFKALSSNATTTITVIPINHKPNVLIDVYKFTSESGGGVIETLNTSDQDGDNVICSVVALPKQIAMYDDNGVQITSVPKVLPNNAYSFKLLDPSIITPTPFSNVLTTFTINCVDDSKKTIPKGVLSTGDVIGNVQYSYINTPPKTNIGSVKLSQDSFIAFSFNGSDTETQETLLKVKLYSLPINGQLSKTLDSNYILTKELIGDSAYGLDELTYTPLPGQSNWDTIDHLGPLDRISYSIVDPQGLLSPSTTMSFQVRSRNPPIYLGDSEINVLQNTRYPLTIEGQVGGGGLSVSIRVLNFSGRGNLSISYSMGKEGFIDKQITEYPSQQIGSTSYNFAYNPPRNQFGSNFDQIQFVLYDNDIISKIYNITVNVIHVNQPPTAELISYRVLNHNNQFEEEILINNYGSTINMNVNDSVLIKILGSDIDNQKVPLIALVSNPPLRGSIYSYNSNSSDFLGVEINRTSQYIPQNVDDGYWYVIFIPTKDSTGNNYARIPFNFIDEKGVVSQTSTVTVNVNSVNLAPKIYIGSNSMTVSGQVNLTISITNVTLDDPDSVNNNVSLIVSIVDQNKDDEVMPLSTIKLSFLHSTNCKPDSNLALINCIGSKKSLNASISTISVVGSISGNYSLKLFIDDLGYNAPSAVRDRSHLNATEYVKIVINPIITTTQNTNNKTVLSGAIAGSAVGAALLAIGLWRTLKKSSPPTDTFFDESAFMGDVSSNPIYEKSETSYVSRIYESAND